MSLMHPNLEPFGDINDTIGRLIPFHLLQNTETPSILKLDDSKEKDLLDKYSNLLDRLSHTTNQFWLKIFKFVVDYDIVFVVVLYSFWSGLFRFCFD